MPEPPPAAAGPPRRRRPPGARRFVAGALASAVAIFGVLALRVHAGQDPALGHAKASSATASPAADTSSSSSSSSTVDPYATGTTSTDGGTTSSDQLLLLLLLLLRRGVARADDPRLMSRLDLTFPAMGGEARLLLADHEPGDEPSPRLRAAAAEARALLAELEARWTRFDPDSDLSRLTADPRRAVPAHAHVRSLVRAGAWAGRISGGLVDITLGDEVVRAGYAGHWSGETAPLAEALAAAPPRAAAAPHPAARWRALGIDGRKETIHRPPGVALDSGGLGKGLAADLVAARLTGLRYVVDLGGDLAVGHGGGGAHEIAVEDPLRPGATLHRLRLGGGGVATSGIHRRLWLDADGRPAHHLLDPATGRPAWTGLLAATAVGRTALEAEVTAKVALLRGPSGARAALAALGGVLVHEDGRAELVPPLRRVAARAVGDRARAAAA